MDRKDYLEQEDGFDYGHDPKVERLNKKLESYEY